MDQMAEFEKRILLLGCGAVGQCALPLLLKHIRVAPGKVTVLDFEDKRADLIARPKTLDELRSVIVQCFEVGIPVTLACAASAAFLPRQMLNI